MKCYTHAGIFHADEVLATAILRRVSKGRKEKFDLTRVFNVPEDVEDDAIVFDIGGGAYDHHSRDIEYRDNGVPFASAGLIWRDFGRDYLVFEGCPDEYISVVFEEIDENLVQAVDARDNGYNDFKDAHVKCNLTFSDMVSSFNPTWDENGDDAGGHRPFWRAVKFAAITFDRFVKRTVSEYKARNLVLDAIARSENHIMVLDRFAPWQKTVLEEGSEDVWFVIYPSKRGGYSWQVVPTSKEDPLPRCQVPVEWWGADEESLKEISGVNDAIFCHRNGFLGSCGSIEGCRLMLEKPVFLLDLAQNIRNRKATEEEGPC